MSQITAITISGWSNAIIRAFKMQFKLSSSLLNNQAKPSFCTLTTSEINEYIILFHTKFFHHLANQFKRRFAIYFRWKGFILIKFLWFNNTVIVDLYHMVRESNAMCNRKHLTAILRVYMTYGIPIYYRNAETAVSKTEINLYFWPHEPSPTVKPQCLWRQFGFSKQIFNSLQV